jgi:predicted metal-dependent peptidase
MENKVQKMTAKEKFDWVISFMTIEDRFCFQMLSMMKKVPSRQISTMGVRPTAIGVQLTYNPDFLEELTIEELRFVLTHEVMHVALHHITKRPPSDPSESELFNIAADLAINSEIRDEWSPGSPGQRHAPRAKEDIKDGSGKVVVKKGDRMGCFPEDKEFGFEPSLSLDNYMHLLRDQQKESPQDGEGEDSEENSGGEGQDQNGQGQGGGGQGNDQDQENQEGNGQGQGSGEESEGDGQGSQGGKGNYPKSFDSHEGWEPNDVVSEQIRKKIEHIEKTNSWGSMSGRMIEKIKAAQRSEVPWSKLLRHYLGQLITSNRVPTYKRPNKRFGYPYSGHKNRHVDKKLVAIDTSVSVGSKELAKFLTEINSLAQLMPVDLMLFDTELQYPKAIPFDRKKAEYDFRGRGGTAFTPVFEYAKKNRYKSLIVLTDGYAEAVEKPGLMDVIWVLTPDGQCPVDYGKVVKIQKVE